MKALKRAAKWLGDRLSERSTWFGVTAFMTAAGYITADQQEPIIAAGLAAGGLIAAFTKDKAVDVKKEIEKHVKPEALNDADIADRLQRGIY